MKSVRESRSEHRSASRLACCVAMVSMAVAAPAQVRPVLDFSAPSTSGTWISINDDVMGGLSTGGFRLTDQGTLLFSGDLSLENRGGFASIRTRPSDLGLDGVNAIVLEARGDGRSYYLDLRTASRTAAGSYRALFATQPDTWQEVRIPFASFQYAAFGRRIRTTDPLDPARVRSIGFTLAEKKAGPFRLEIRSIAAEGSGGSDDEPAEPAAHGGDDTPRDIVDTAIAAGRFDTLVAALQTAELAEPLKGEGPWTVFAPDDDAFARLPEGTVDQLLRPENREQLRAILSYHVLSGAMRIQSSTPTTLQGDTLAIRTPGSVRVNDATVTAADIEASNGVIHVIDRVLMPPTGEEPQPHNAAREVIELAISRGAPLFNEGQPAACTALYEVTARSLLGSRADALTPADRKVLRDALRTMRSQEDPRDQAWTLRRALDSVYHSLGSRE